MALTASALRFRPKFISALLQTLNWQGFNFAEFFQFKHWFYDWGILLGTFVVVCLTCAATYSNLLLYSGGKLHLAVQRSGCTYPTNTFCTHLQGRRIYLCQKSRRCRAAQHFPTQYATVKENAGLPNFYAGQAHRYTAFNSSFWTKNQCQGLSYSAKNNIFFVNIRPTKALF